MNGFFRSGERAQGRAGARWAALGGTALAAVLARPERLARSISR